MTPETPHEPPPTRIEVCEKHGLRYNAAVDDGCARCRTEAGTRTMQGVASSTRRKPDMTRSLLVAAALVVGAGVSLYSAHSVVYAVGASVVESLSEDVTDEAPEEIPEESPNGEQEDLDAVFDQLIGDS